MNQRRYFLNIASGYSNGRDCATVYVSHEKLFGIYFGEYSEDIFSSKGTKKDPAGGGNVRFFASRPLRQDHGSGSGTLEESVSRSFLSVLTSSTTVREPPHRPFPCPSDSPPRPRRKHRPCPAICLTIVFFCTKLAY